MRFSWCAVWALPVLALVSGFAAAQDDAQDGAPVTERKPGPHPPSQELRNPIERNEASIRAGKQVYDRFCVTCHGADGKGKTDMVEFLPAPPSDLTDGEWKYGKTDGELFTLVRDGTKFGMDPFKGKINDQRMWHVVNYLRSIGPDSDEAVAEDIPQNPVEATPENVAAGKQVYLRQCVKCHGKDGTGFTEMMEFLATPPSDFTNGKWKYGGEDGQLFKIIRDGTRYDMEAFKDRLTDEQMWQTVLYVKTFVKD